MAIQLDRTKLQSVEFLNILAINRARKISLFGSYAEGRACETSDIDFLVEFDEAADLLDMVGLKLELEDYFGKKVDIVTVEALSKYLRANVLEHSIPIYG